MYSPDVVVAGGGVAGLLIASSLASKFSVILLEQNDSLPQNKYWLTDAKALAVDAQFEACLDRRYNEIDFVAYDGLTATISGNYCLWNTEQLIGLLSKRLLTNGGKILTGYTLYSFKNETNTICIRANAVTFQAKLLIDCMGFGSPIVGAKHVATITGYYVLYGSEIAINDDIKPVALDNVVLNSNPAFFELFPTSKATAHAAIILPSRSFKPERSLQKEFSFILNKSHYAANVRQENTSRVNQSYFGVVPVGRLHSPALDRIVFFGEAGQANPAASATGLTRMLRTYRDLSAGLETCLRSDRLMQRHLLRVMPTYMTPMNRSFQESLFESLLSFDSDRFRQLVEELGAYPDNVVNDLLFAEFDFRSPKALQLALDAVRRPRSVLGRNVLKSILRFCTRPGLF
jgi:2-polyprenyl-6-methoxyphenol hydroxylase-like FAD-dependent oxidoreductase